MSRDEPLAPASSSETRSFTPSRWHRFVEHTGEMRLEVHGESLAGLLAESGRALGLLLLGSSRSTGSLPPRTIELSSHDREALIVDWLNEILFLAETELCVPVEVDVEAVSDTILRASIRPAPLPERPSLVKAATLHDVRVERDGDGMRFRVVLDV